MANFIDAITWPGFIQTTSDGDMGYTDISGDLPSLGTTNLNVIFQPCQGQAWTGGAGGNLWHLENGTWTKDTTHPFGTSQIRSIWGPDCDTIFICTNSGKIATWTSSGGWGSLHTTPTTDTMKSIHGIDDQTLWCCGNNDEMWFTTNGGSSWAAQTTPFGGAENIQSVRAIDSQTAIACGQDGTVIRTVNAGSTWTEDTTPNTATANWIWFSISRDSNGFPDEIWIGQNGGMILFYNGTSWVEQVDFGTDDVHSIIGANASNILACGGDADFIIWHYDGTDWTEILSNATDDANAIAWIAGSRPMACGEDGEIYESDMEFDLNGDFIIPLPLTQQPEGTVSFAFDWHTHTGTSIDYEAFVSDTGEFVGEEIFLLVGTEADPTGILELNRRYYQFRMLLEAVAEFSPVIDKLTLLRV